MAAGAMTNALHMIGRDVPPMATCPGDGEPLIVTLAFPRAEFACVGCGRLLGFLDPKAETPTPDLNARLEANQRTWAEQVLPLLEAGDHDAARRWLHERRRR
jgi:hypothetical protein